MSQATVTDIITSPYNREVELIQSHISKKNTILHSSSTCKSEDYQDTTQPRDTTTLSARTAASILVFTCKISTERKFSRYMSL